MARRFFDSENALWEWIGKVPQMLGLSLLWAIFCLPVVTVVPATCALYDAVARNLRPDKKGCFRRFFRTFRNELGRGILMSLLWLVIFGVLFVGGRILSAGADSSRFHAIYALVYQVLSLIPGAVFLWAITLESRFVYSFGVLHKNALLITFSHLPQTGLALLVTVLSVILCRYVPILVLLMPAILAALLSIPVENVLTQYMPEEE